MKFLIYTLIAIIALYILLTLFIPATVEKGMNKSHLSKPYQISEKAMKLLQSFEFVADLHSDALLWDRALYREATYGHVDFRRMQKGNTALQAFTIVSKSPKGQNFQQNSADAPDNITLLAIAQGQPIGTWFSLLHRALYQCEKLHRHARRFGDEFIVVKSKADLQNLVEQRKTDRKVIGGFLGVEGGHCLEGDIKNLDRIFDAGVRMLGPTHFFDNGWVGVHTVLSKEASPLLARQ